MDRLEQDFTASADMQNFATAKQIASTNSRRGVVVPLVAIMLPVIMIMAGFAVNLSYMELTRTELRIAADAATRAAGRTLIDTNDLAQTRTVARDAVARNKVAGSALQLADADIEFGLSERTSMGSRYSFAPGGANPNAVRVTARRDVGSLSGLVNMIVPVAGAADSFGAAQSSVSSRVELDVALVLDRSGSMAYGDDENSYNMAVAGLPPSSAPAGWAFCNAAPPGSRWRDLITGVTVFNNVLSQTYSSEHVTLVTYASSAKIELDLTSNYSAVLDALDPYTQSLCAGSTNIGDGIDLAINALSTPGYSRPWASKVIVVLTDGKHNVGTSPENAAIDAADQGVTVFTITFSAEADQSRMIRVSEHGSGKHFHAANGAALQQAFIDIARSLPTLLTD